jgi:anti-sigma regulatory factor (Ser/Thr protein kinase)
MSRELEEGTQVRRTPASIALVDAGSELPRAIRWLDGFAAANRLPERTRLDLQIVLDEVISNIVKYAYPGPAAKPVRLRLDLDDAIVELLVEDDGVPFDPLSVPVPDVDARLPGRNAGGLGIHLVRHLTDAVVYTRVAGCNRLRVTKKLFAEEGSGIGTAGR